jgi:hypothetical protein
VLLAFAAVLFDVLVIGAYCGALDIARVSPQRAWTAL